MSERANRGRRWLRLVIPPGLVVLLIALSSIFYAVEQPDQDDAAYLSPVSAEAVGGRRLADLLDESDITVERQTKTSDALVSAHRGGATLLITTPNLVHSYYLRMLKLMPASTAVVLVEPNRKSLRNGLLPIGTPSRALTSHPREPGCALPAAHDAGRAAVGRTVFGRVLGGAVEQHRCYDGSLVAFRHGSAQITVVGSADPFRNDRLYEFNNAKLALGLLSGAPRLIWLDLHHPERRPGYVDDPALAGQSAAPPSLGPQPSGASDRDFPLPGGSEPEPGGEPQGGGPGDGGDGGNPLAEAFPPWTYASALLIALAALLLAAARARRLGAPISEPLPVTVRASETVEGRGRLYQRVKARGAALETLRAAAAERLAHLLGLGPDPDSAVMVAAVASHSGWPPQAVEDALYGEAPTDDEALVRAAATLESLLNAVTAPEGDHP